METAYNRGSKSVEAWIKQHHSDFSFSSPSGGGREGALGVGLSEGNPSAASFMKFQAFTTATVQDQRIRTRIQAALSGNLKRGEGARKFGEVVDSEFDKAGLTRLKPHQIENIYRTNTSLAYSAGQMGKMIEVSDDFPYWKYSATMDSKTRPDHAALHGKIFRTGDFTFWPPIGFKCRCTAIPLTARQAGQYLKTAMPSPEERQQLLNNTGNAEFLGNKQENYMKWLGKEYAKADKPTQKLIDKAFDSMRAEIGTLQKEGLKQFFGDKFVKDTWDEFRNNEKYTLASRAAKLTTRQAYYIHAYTLEAPLYRELNGWLFREIPTANYSRSQLLTMKRNLAGSLRKLPKYKGVVYRQLDDLPADTLKQYKVGATINWDGFSSASTMPRLYEDRKIMFIINSKTARSVESLSGFSNEKETLFLPGKFKITERQKQGDLLVFKMDEL